MNIHHQSSPPHNPSTRNSETLRLKIIINSYPPPPPKLARHVWIKRFEACIQRKPRWCCRIPQRKDSAQVFCAKREKEAESGAKSLERGSITSSIRGYPPPPLDDNLITRVGASSFVSCPYPVQSNARNPCSVDPHHRVAASVIRGHESQPC